MFVNGSGLSLRANLQHSSKYCNVFLAFSVFILYSGLANRGPYDLGCCISLLKNENSELQFVFVFFYLFFFHSCHSRAQISHSTVPVVAAVAVALFAAMLPLLFLTNSIVLCNICRCRCHRHRRRLVSKTEIYTNMQSTSQS